MIQAANGTIPAFTQKYVIKNVIPKKNHFESVRKKSLSEKIVVPEL